MKFTDLPPTRSTSCFRNARASSPRPLSRPPADAENLAIALQPRTLGGLAVLARAATISNPALWSEDDGDRVESHALKRLIEATCDLAGVPYSPAR